VLVPVDSARYNARNAPPGCLEGTCSSVLSLLHDWSRISSPEFGVFWLFGTAGTGKTTVAKTFCDQLALEGTLGSSFFICRRDETRRDPHNIIRTLAYDLAVLNASRAQSVWESLTSAPNIASLHISEQTRCLLARPSALQQVRGFSTIVIIDAIDELDRSGEENEDLVALLVSALKNQAVKLVFTSRNEPQISMKLNGLTDETLKLHRMELDMGIRVGSQTNINADLDQVEWNIQDTTTVFQVYGYCVLRT
jgi:predicted ATPase